MITRHYVAVEGRKVHYRRCGRGPTLVLLHASPVSSKVFEPLMRFHAQSFTTFAFDTPGNGLSDPLLADDPDMADYGIAQAKALDALEIKRAIAYGRHTGASVAASMAELRPDLIALAMTDGYPVFSKEQRKAYLSGYLNDLPVEEDGSHLTWLWNRYRDQFLFWPWNKKDIANRADCDMPDVDFIHNGVIALMEAGNNYKAPYRAVFKHDAIATLERADPPICVAARPGDSLYRQFAEIPAEFWKEDIPRDFAEASMRELELMLPHMPDRNAPAPKQSEPIGGLRHDFVSCGADQLHMVERQRSGRPIVMISPAPGSLDPLIPLIREIGNDRHIIAIEPAGCGDSDTPSDGDTSIDRQADRVVECVHDLGVEACDFVGWSAGGAIALEAARRCRSQNVVVCNPLLIHEPLRASYANAFAETARPQMDGGHLVRLWREVRDGELFFPWFDARRQAARPSSGIDFDAETLTRKTLMLAKHAKSHSALWRSAWSYSWHERVSNYNGAMTLLYTETSMIPSEQILDMPDTPIASCGGHPDSIAAAILKVLED